MATKECTTGGGLYIGKDCGVNGFLQPETLIFCRSSELFSPSDFSTEAAYKALIIAEKIFPVTGVFDAPDASKDNINYESPNGDEILRQYGKRGYDIMFYKSYKNHKIFFANASFYDAVIYVDAEGRIRCSTDTISEDFDASTSKLRGIPLSTNIADAFKNPTLETPTFTSVRILEKSVYDTNKFGRVQNTDFLINDIHGLEQVKLEAGSVTTGVFDIDVNGYDADDSDVDAAVKTFPVTALEDVNINITKPDGTPIDVANIALVDNGNGNYTVTTTTTVAEVGDNVTLTATVDSFFISNTVTLE